MLTPPRFAPLMIFFILCGKFILLYGWQYRHLPNVDLPSFYAASVSVFKNGGSPYEADSLRHVMSADFHVYPYLYPPPSLLVFFPLSEVAYQHARIAVLAMNNVLPFILIWIISRRLVHSWPQHNMSALTLCTVYILNFSPVVITINHGQINLLCLTSLVLFWILARGTNIALATLFLASAILLKTYPLVIIPLLALIGRWRECLYTGAWLTIPLVASVILLPGLVWHDWLTDVLPTGGYARTPVGLFSPAAVWNQSLNGFFARLFTESQWSNPLVVNPGLARSLTYGAAGLTMAVTAIAVWRSRIHIDSLDRMLLTALPLMYLVAPFSWEHHLVFLLPAILMLLNSQCYFGFWPKVIFYVLCTSTAIFIGMPVLLEAKFYAVVVLWGLCLFAAVTKGVTLTTDALNIKDERPAVMLA